jgi:phytoene dehydrogenase-like protein
LIWRNATTDRIHHCFGMSGMKFDAVVIGSGLGALTAGALLAHEGFSVCLAERNTSLGGSASCYKAGNLTIEASLHETTDPRDPHDQKHGILQRLGLLDKIAWVPCGGLFTVRGGPIGDPFSLPDGFGAAQGALAQRFPGQKASISRVLGKMERLCDTVGRLTDARESRSLSALVGALARCGPLVSGWQSSLHDVLQAEFGSDEAVKIALAANLPYYSADPKQLWWIFFAIAQGGYLASGGVYIQGGSRQLSVKLGGVIKKAGGTVLLGAAATAIEVDRGGTVNAVHIAGQGQAPSQRVEARVVLAGCAPSALAAMLPEEASQRVASAFENLPLSTSLFTAHFGLKANPAAVGLTAYSTTLLPSWFTGLGDYVQSAALLGGMPNGRMPPFGIANYGAISSGLDDHGPPLVTVVGVDKASNWRGVSKDEDKRRRAAWLDAILGELEKHYPGFAGAVTDKVFVNAASVERYLGTPEGAVYGFDPQPPRSSILAGTPRSPKTPIQGLYLASSFGGSGGFTGAMAAGADAARLAKAALERRAAT